MSVRVYVPATLDWLARWASDGAVPAEVERFVADDDSEDAEYAALVAAADASAALVTAPGRRVVLVAELPDADAEAPWRLVAAVHADIEDVDTSEPERLDDLSWFAVQEVPDLLGQARS